MKESHSSGKHPFHTTQWSVVLTARRDSNMQFEDWRESMESLCQSYWYPLYAYLRRKGYGPSDAQDLTQDFFASLIEKDFLKTVKPEQGRFRWFLMDAIKKFAAKWSAAQSTKKRGGDRQIFSLSFEQGENQYRREPVDGWTAERLFDRRWALQLLETSLQQLKQDYDANGKTRFFNALKVFLTADGAPPSYDQVAEELNLTPTAVKVAIHRLREKYRQKIRDAVAETLDDVDRLDEEISALMAAL